MASRWCELLCPQPKQVASESMHGARLAAQQLSRGCDACDVEAGKPCMCAQGQDETAAAGRGRVAAVALAVTTQQHHSKPTSTFAQSVINMVGMLIGKKAYATYYITLFLIWPNIVAFTKSLIYFGLNYKSDSGFLQ